ncbi:MAG: hypothetical protein QM661_13725 [Solimonas sp.]
MIRRCGFWFALPAAFGAWAHEPPVAECRPVDGQMIECRGGFGQIGNAPGVTMDVIADDERILLHGRLDRDSTLRFARPAGAFYVLLDAGPGQTVEIDGRQIGVAR